MSEYRYFLNDYHAVKAADIHIKGITVLAGENGCGKSTLSRWLYYLVNGAEKYDELLFNEYKRHLTDRIQRLSMPYRDMRRAMNENVQIFQNQGFGSHHISRVSYDDVEGYNKIQEEFLRQIYVFGDKLLAFLSANVEQQRRDRILSFLSIDNVEGQTNEQIVEDFIDRNRTKAIALTDKYNQDKENRPLGSLFNLIAESFEETDPHPDNIQLEEDGDTLVSVQSFGYLYNLHRAIYVDTPMALASDDCYNIFWRELIRLMFRKGAELNAKEKVLLHRIRRILGGSAVIVEPDDPLAEDELRYVSEDNLVNIEIEKTATGFKTFAYLQRLLENGYLNENTLLLIDEPEAHLHPQWIFEYARLLVLLHKQLGLKVMLATHNPDMVSALRAIAAKESVLADTQFYLAYKSEENEHQYCYENLGSQITEIFKSFNIALDRIGAYGTHDI